MSEQTLNASFTHAQRKVVAELIPELADRLLLDTSNQRTLPFTLDELQTMQQKAHEAIRHAENGMIRNSLRHIIETTTKAIEDSQGIGSIPTSERLFQFKITLIESQPPIWRRNQVKNGTLDKLHERIQTAMAGLTRIFMSSRSMENATAILNFWTMGSRTSIVWIRPSPRSARSCPRTASGFNFFMNMISETAGHMRSCLRAVSEPSQASDIPCVLKANEPAHPKMLEESGDTPSSSKRWQTRITSSTKSFSNGEDRLIQRSSTL